MFNLGKKRLNERNPNSQLQCNGMFADELMANTQLQLKNFFFLKFGQRIRLFHTYSGYSHIPVCSIGLTKYSNGQTKSESNPLVAIERIPFLRIGFLTIESAIILLRFDALQWKIKSDLGNYVWF